MLNWKEDLDGVLLALGEIEGDAWLAWEERFFDEGRDEDINDSQTVAGVVRWFERVFAETEVEDEEDQRYLDRLDGEVYGSGGFNRYFFYGDGSVRISTSHICGLLSEREKTIAKAISLGINV